MFKSIITLLGIIIAAASPNKLCTLNNNQCLSCAASFAYLRNNTCLVCPIECATCSGTTTCLTCRPNYYLSNGSCILCPENCQVCSPVCSQCIDGFSLLNNVCVACADSNALTCQTPTTVTACTAGYWANGNSCSPCRQFCLQCSSSSNCFSCQDGYQVSVSFGSYCSACPSGCKSCSSSGCSQCLYNYRLMNGVCTSIYQNCSTIAHCAKCTYGNTSTICHSCYYPYYINGSNCVLGASMLCQNGSIGPMFYECIDYCWFYGYQIGTFRNGIVCQPNSWINSNYQYYLNPYSLLFSSVMLEASQEIIAYNATNSSNSVLSFTVSLNPYYKLDIFFKMVAINLDSENVMITYQLNDNRTNYESKSFNQSFSSDYEPFYNNFTTKIMQDQLVSFSIFVQNNNTSQPIIGLSELIINVYSCPVNCRLCYNKQLCIQCYGDYFNTPDNTCVSSCTGYIQLFLPNGNPDNYTSKSCVLQCPSSFYTYQNGSQYICIKCSGTCVTCLSDYQCLSCNPPLLYYEINYTCLHTCPNTHYNSSYICVPCIAPCQTCLDSSTCLTCSVGYLSNNKCESICHLGTYQNNLNNTCSPCSPKCTSCFGSPTYCISCNIPYLLSEFTCVSNCTSSLYFQNDRVCEPCVIPCRQCLSETQCLSCSVGYLFGTKCLGQCPSGYYADSFKAVCNVCSNRCLTCISLTICLSCPNSTNLYSYSCYSTCPTNTYSSSSICLSCLLPCGNCLNQTFCITCSIGYLSQVTAGLCVNNCQNGFYRSRLNRSCLACTNNCSTCSVISYLCTSCPPHLLLQNSACVQNCVTGMFNLSGTCYSCTYPCLTCNNNDYYCTSCYSSYILINSTCQTQCPPYTYLQDNFCHSCLYPCQSCFSSTGCFTCEPNALNQAFLSDSQCVTTCPSNTFADVFSLTCRNCLYPCQNCLSEQICLSCASGYLDVQSGACTICSDMTFPNDTSRQCQKCSLSIANCEICVSSSECTKCAINYYLFNSTCISSDTCVGFANFYVDNLLQTCQKCVSPCKDCVNESFCMSCQSGSLLNGNCLVYCPSNYYDYSNMCFRCLPPCLTCSSDAQCLTCNTTSQFSVLLVINSTCISSSECLSGFYLAKNINQFECLKCIPPCQACLNASFCQSCLAGILINGNCKALCPSMYYAAVSADNLTICLGCSVNCFKCNKNANYCTSCFEGMYLRNNTCVTNCGNGYYLDQTVLQCFACLRPCGNCSSISSCLDCLNTSFILYFGECLASCPDGSYSNQSTCYSCPPTCLTCAYWPSNSLVRCSTCNSGLFMSTQLEGTCVANCSLLQYGDIITRYCYNCIAPCLSCINAIRCLSCQPDYLLYQQQCLKISRCPSLSYLLVKSCISNCGDLWAGPSSAKCLQHCEPPFLKMYQNNSKSCLSICPSGYRVDANYSCASCMDGKCSNLLNFQMEHKNIFNILFLKLTFNQLIQGKLLKPEYLSITLNANSQGRLLTGQYINFSITQINLNAIWIQLQINQTLRSATITLNFNSFYIFSLPLQALSFDIIIRQFDYYPPQEKTSAEGFQKFAQAISIVMVFLFAVNLCLNSGYLSYGIIDYYQLLFMVLFLSIDFPPQLNHFLYGFRYSHYLFLPQIFRGSAQDTYTTSTPDQFGVIVPDVNFINNTGHDFIIIFSTLAVLVFCKVVEVLLEKVRCFRSNKVRGEQEGESQHNSQMRVQQSESCFGKFAKAIIKRFKWNYFNDINYTIYFSIMLFAFSQLYDLEWKSASALGLVSIILAFFFLIVGLFFPFFLVWFLRKNEKDLIEHSLQKQKLDYLTDKKQAMTVKNRQFSKENKGSEHDQENLSKLNAEMSSSNTQNEQNSNKFEILTDYKCFLSGIKLKVRLGFYQIPIRYIKKLMLAALLVYCSQYPSFVLGVIMMLCFINMLITIVLKPYRLTFEQVLYPIFDGLYLLIFFIICVMQIPLLDLTKPQKLSASYAAISLITLLSLLLAIHNIIMNIVQIIKFFWKVDYLGKYYQTEYVSSSEEESDHQTDQGTNIPMKKEEPEGEQMTGQEIFSGLDIYLKKESTAPKYLIKCVKNEAEKGVRPQSNEGMAFTEGSQNIRFSNDRLTNQRRASNQLISDANNREMAQKIVKGIHTLQLSQGQQSESSQVK